MAIETELNKMSEGMLTNTDKAPIETPILPEEEVNLNTNVEEQPIDLMPKNEGSDGVELAMSKVPKDIVGGIINKVSDVFEAKQKKVYGNVVQKDLVVDYGNSLIIRPADEFELEDFTDLLPKGDEKSPGINFYSLGEELTKDQSMKALFAFDVYDQNLASFFENIKKANEPLFKKMRRDKTSIETMKKIAEKNGLRDIVIKMINRKPGEVFPAEDTLGSLIAMVNLGKITDRHIKKAIKTKDNTDRLIALRFIALQSKLSASLSGNVSEYARGMATIRWASKISPNGSLEEYANQLDSIVQRFENVEDVDLMFNMYVDLPKNLQVDFIKKGIFAKGTDALMEIYINVLLSSPITHIVNMSGNSLFSALKILEDIPAGVIGGVRTAMTGGDKTDRKKMIEAYYKSEGILKSITDAVVLSTRTFFKEQTGIEGTKIDLPNNRSIGKTGDVSQIIKNIANVKEYGIVPNFMDILGVYFRTSSRFLITEDEFFRVMAMGSAKYNIAGLRSLEAYELAIKDGKSIEEATAIKAQVKADIINNPPNDVMENITDYAKELTFTGDLEGFLANSQIFTSHPLVKVFVPFFKTPVNIFTEVFDRTLPFNVYKKLKTGTGREKDEAMAKLAMGWGIGLSYYLLAMGDTNEDFYCVGSGPDDRNVKKAWLNQNNQSYSCVVSMEDGTKKTITYSRLDPVSPILAMASDLHYYLQHEDDLETAQLLTKTFTLAMADYMSEHPMLQTIGELSSIMGGDFPGTNSDRYDRVVELIGQKATEVGTGMLPWWGKKVGINIPSSSSFSAYLERFDDPTASNTMLPEGRANNIFGEDIGYYTDTSPAVRGFYKALQKAKSRNPLWNHELPPNLNLWGETLMQSSGAKWEYYSPIRIKELKYSPIDKEIERLGNAGAGGLPMPNQKIDGVLLNNVEYNKYIRLINEVDHKGRLPEDLGYNENKTLKNSLMDMIESDEYLDAMTAMDQIDMLRDILSNRKSSARKILIQGSRLNFYFDEEE